MPVAFRILFLAILTYAPSAFAEVRVELSEDNPKLEAQLNDAVGETGAPQTPSDALRQARRAADRLADYLNSEGYFRAQTSAALIDGLESAVRVRSGPRFRVADISVEFDHEDVAPAAVAAAASALSLAEGDVARAEDVIAAEQAAVDALLALGYADATALERDVFGDAAAETVDVVFRLHAGPRVIFGQVRYDDGVRTRRVYLERLIPFEAGDVYSPAQIAEFNRRLSATRLYKVATASLAPSDRAGRSGDEVRDVRVAFVERDRYSIGLGGSYSSSEGAGVSVSWTRRNATRRGDILEIEGNFATLEQTVSADWRFPNAFGYGRDFTANVESGREETDAFDRDFAALSANLDVRASLTRTYVFGAALETSRETDAFEVRDLRIASASGAIVLDHSDSFLEPAEGWRAAARLEPGWITGDEDAQYLLTSAEGSVYRSFGPKGAWVAALRGRVGGVAGADSVDLPASRRFFAGGGGSVRGYAYQSIGPRDEDNNPIGGRGLLETNAELRWRRSERLGFAAFLDGGAVSARETPEFDDMRFGAGVGLRYYTAIGAVRFDVAVPLDRREGDDALQFYVNLGQAF